MAMSTCSAELPRLPLRSWPLSVRMKKSSGSAGFHDTLFKGREGAPGAAT